MKSGQSKKRSKLLSSRAEALIREYIWEAFAISTHMDEVRESLATRIGISGPQWLILMAIDYLDQGTGVQVGNVSAQIHVNSTFVTTQTKRLEELGFVSRSISPSDRRVVLLSLTKVGCSKLASVASHRQFINESIFSDLSEGELADLVQVSGRIRRRFEKAVRVLNAQHLTEVS
jgi:MarR family transcriptional regulator, organic hydroperoxide resistance regulator